MIKKLCVLIFVFINILNADVLHNKIINLIGQNDYNRNKNIINVLFNDRNKFFLGGELKVVAVLEELKNNGLLKLNFNDPKDFILEFEIVDKSINGIYVVNSVLNKLGYYYYFTQNVQKDSTQNLLKWDIILNTEYIVDPVLLSNEFSKNQVKIVDVTKKEHNIWTYRLDMKVSRVPDTIKVSTNEKISLQKPLKPYMIEIGDAKELNVTSKRLDNWFPYIIFFDEMLRPLYIISKNERYSGLKSAIPDGTKYIQIGDLYNLVNIKRGLTLVIKG
ncbi:hypothetical protein [Arcobacter sp. FWKO B]|uniref:hypothetical protein n=1 Tax=Arcobacter sp. FWKO B TaxID=2593672 RepID=UPI0018A4A1C3|nr:hypothetical protein [Arcobacter sp. FWKO B]QOG12567.1 hypothetical protein FWKOB_07550 [Arcobacter sp. FWKO B]